MTPHEKAVLTYKALQERKKKRLRDANSYCCELALKNSSTSNKLKYGKKVSKQV